MNSVNLVKSPLNYTGGKFKLLPQILPLFPKKIDTFIDLFCGGCNVGMNVDADRVIFNDNNRKLIDLYETLRALDKDVIFEQVYEIIDRYRLSISTDYGYAHYACDSAKGLASYNRKRFLQLREDFNSGDHNFNPSIMFYVVIVYAFNNAIRFNSKGEFNEPAGKRDFNDRMKEKLSTFIDKLKAGNYSFSCKDFRKLNTVTWTDNSLVYCDPPYLITTAAYNEQGGWTEDDERDLLTYLDYLNKYDIKFALSNVLSSKGLENELLKRWSVDYKVIHLDYNYSNCNYSKKDKAGLADEVLVVNFD